MTIEIQTEKTINVDGKKVVSLKIIGMQERYQLPDEYTTSAPAVWYFDHGLMIMDGVCQEPKRIHPRDLSGMSPETADALIAHIQDSGIRLAVINARIRRERALYDGNSKILI